MLQETSLFLSLKWLWVGAGWCVHNSNFPGWFFCLWLVTLQCILQAGQCVWNVSAIPPSLACDACHPLRLILSQAPGWGPAQLGSDSPRWISAPGPCLMGNEDMRPRKAHLQDVFPNDRVSCAAKVSRMCLGPGLAYGAACKVAPS